MIMAMMVVYVIWQRIAKHIINIKFNCPIDGHRVVEYVPKKTLFGKERYEKNVYENRSTKNYTYIVSITYNSRRNVLTIIIITEQMQIQATIIIGIHTASKSLELSPFNQEN